MAYTRLDKLLTLGTAAERAAFTPDPPSGVVSIWHESDTGDHYAWSGSAWVQINGGGGGSVASTDITDSTTVGRAVLTAADAAAARTAIGAQRDGYVGAVAVSGTPTAGQVPIASSGTAAAWGTLSSGSYEVADWPALLALTGVPDGREYTVLAPVCDGGLPGTSWTRNSAAPMGWAPKGRQVVYRSSAPVVSGGPTTALQVLDAVLFDAGVLRAVNRFEAFERWSSNPADSGSNRTASIQVGPNGDGTDVTVASVPFAANSRGATVQFDATSTSDTTLASTSGIAAYLSRNYLSTSSAVAGFEPQSTVADMSTTALYVSACVQQASGATATMRLSEYVIEIS